MREVNWNNVKREAPKWFRDAKFGLFFHWGPYSVPAYQNEWYSRNMYCKGLEQNQYHEKTYGSLHDFGYKDFYDMLKGEKFDPDQWASLVKRSGAKYAGAVSEHADNFSMWDSAVNPINSMNYGPHRDIVGECTEAFRKQGIRTVATFHHQWLWGWFMSTDNEADVYIPENEKYYGPALPLETNRYIPYRYPDEAFCKIWRDKVLEVIDKYGADALRMTLMTGNAPGNDMRFYWERVEASRNFANKVWNASRFIMMNIEKAPVTDVKLSDLQMADRWILSKVNTLAKDVTENMDKYELGIALQKVYDFIWEEFCDWYIEMVKPRLWSEKDTTKAAALWTLKTVLIQSLKLLHPYMPFITEEIFCNLQDEEPSIMISSWPEYKDEWNFADEEKAVETIKDAVRAIRGVRTSMNVPPSKKAKVYVVSEDPEVLAIFEHSRVFFATLGYASEVVLQKDKSGIADDAVSAVTAKATIYMPFAELVDLDKEIERLTKEEEKLKKELARSEGMLSNEKFVSRAPEAKIAEEREKLEKYRQMMAQVQERLAQLRK